MFRYFRAGMGNIWISVPSRPLVLSSSLISGSFSLPLLVFILMRALLTSSSSPSSLHFSSRNDLLGFLCGGSNRVRSVLIELRLTALPFGRWSRYVAQPRISQEVLQVHQARRSRVRVSFHPSIDAIADDHCHRISLLTVRGCMNHVSSLLSRLSLGKPPHIHSGFGSVYFAKNKRTGDLV